VLQLSNDYCEESLSVHGVRQICLVFCGFIVLLMMSGCSLWQTNAVESDNDAVSDIAVERVWSMDLDNRNPGDASAFSQPAFHGAGDGLVIAGGRDARAHVLNLSGHERVRVPLKNSSDSGAVFLKSGLAVLGDSGGMLYGIDPETGHIVWDFEMTGALTGVPVAFDDDVLVQTLDNRVYRISEKGEKRWSFSAPTTGLGMYQTPSPLVQNNHVYVLFNNGDAVALKVENGDLIWRKQLLLNNDAAVLSEIQAPQADPVALPQLTMGSNQAKDLILFSFYQGEMIAVSAQDGSRLFSQNVSIKSTPLVQGGMLFLADDQGNLDAYHIDSGQRNWTVSLSKHELVGPVLYHHALWLGDSAGHVFRVSMQGEIMGSDTLPGEINRTPVVTSQGVLVRSNRGALYLMR